MLTLEDQGPIFFVFDAVDECPNSTGTPSPRENVPELIEWLSELQFSHLSICVTSRPEADIEAVLLPIYGFTSWREWTKGRHCQLHQVVHKLRSKGTKMEEGGQGARP
ncbi:hypothetical protein V8E52_007590 [Russula decolorans]|jgi:hypothetical protein